jgi:hypothetical protein
MEGAKMSILDSLKGERRQEFEDFASRYDQGEPWEGISDDEAVSRHDELASELSQDEYETSARESFERLRPEQRKELGRALRQQVRQRNVRAPELDDDDEKLADSGMLAKLTSQLHGQSPGLVGQLLGGGGMKGNPLVKGALGGIAATAAKRFMGK